MTPVVERELAKLVDDPDRARRLADRARAGFARLAQ